MVDVYGVSEVAMERGGRLATSVSSHHVSVATAQRGGLAHDAATANNKIFAHARPRSKRIKTCCDKSPLFRQVLVRLPAGLHRKTRCVCGLLSPGTAGISSRRHWILKAFAAQQRCIGTWLALYKMGKRCAHGAALSNNKNNELKIRKPRRIMAPCFTI